MQILSIQPIEYGYEPTIRHVPPVGEQYESVARGIARREDSLAISPQAIEKIDKVRAPERRNPNEDESSEEDELSDGAQLSEEDKKTVEELKKRDQEVRTHEQSHIAAGGAHVRGGASYSTQAGPDGVQYAVGGHVNIDTSPVSGDPQATITKMQTVRAAAMAPAEPSGQDQAVASQASATLAQAQSEKSDPASESETVKPQSLRGEKETSNDQQSPRAAQRSSILRAYSQSQAFTGSQLNIVG